jgi:hypothetical protein
MNARFLTTATLAFSFAGILPAKAADTQLLNLVMPDAKVLAGVNVDQAKTTPMGQYVLTQVQAQNNQHLREITTLTGFDPTRDVSEILVASSGSANQQSGLVVARGVFDIEKIKAAVALKGGATTTEYNGVTLFTDSKATGGVAFISSTLVAAGDVANVKAAIDRRQRPSTLPADVMVRINQWSGSQDAWAITTVPPTSLAPAGSIAMIPGVGPQQPGQANAFTGIQNASGGVKFGNNVVVTAQAQAANATDATQLGDTLKLLASLAQMQSNGDPKILALAKSLNVTTNGALLNVSISMPQDQLVGFLKEANKPRERAPKNLKKM